MDTGLLTEGSGLAQHNCIILQNDFQTFKRSLLSENSLESVNHFCGIKVICPENRQYNREGSYFLKIYFRLIKNNIGGNAVVSPQIYVQSNQLLNANIILFLQRVPIRGDQRIESRKETNSEIEAIVRKTVNFLL